MVITAKYSGICARCGGATAVGEQIDWVRGGATTHAKCPTRPAAPAGVGTIRVSQGEGYGGRPFRVGEVIADDPGAGGKIRYLYTISTSSTYYAEDGMSFGVGDEQGHMYHAICRLATDEEAAPVIAADEERMRKALHRRNLDALFCRIQREGEYPEGQHSPEGRQIVLQPRTIYGGGHWLVVGADYIWAVRNNGADGDDWGHNNVETGGAGAIGHRMPLTPELTSELAGY